MVARLLFLVVGLGLVVVFSLGSVRGGVEGGGGGLGVDNEVGGVGWWGFGFWLWVLVVGWVG